MNRWKFSISDKFSNFKKFDSCDRNKECIKKLNKHVNEKIVDEKGILMKNTIINVGNQIN